MTGLILVVMKAIGHLDIFFNSLKLLSNMGSGGDDSFYGPMVLVKNFINSYSASLKYTVFIAGVILLATVAVSFLKKYSFYKQWVVDLIKYAIILFLCVWLLKGKIDREILLYFYTGIVLITTVLIVFTKTVDDIKLLALMG